MLSGNCLCKAIEYTIDFPADGASGVACHCNNCKHQSSGPSYNLQVKASDITVTKGKPTVYADPETSSGKPMNRNFCGNCGSALWSIPTAEEDTAFAKLGCIKEGGKISIDTEIFAENANPKALHSEATQLDSKYKPYKA